MMKQRPLIVRRKKRYDYDTVVVCIPTHCSALSTTTLLAPSFIEKQHAVTLDSNNLQCNSNCGDDDHVSATTATAATTTDDYHNDYNDDSDDDILYIQCHYDRIIWNFFRPLFIKEEDTMTTSIDTCSATASTSTDDTDDGSTPAAIRAIQILINAFQNFIMPVCYNWIEEEKKEKETERMMQQQQQQSNNVNEEERKEQRTLFVENKKLWNHQCYHAHSYWKKNHARAKSRTNTNTNSTTKVLHLILLPVYPIASSSSSSSSSYPYCNLYPEQLFTSALVRQENLYVKLQTLNAFIATMGGGYFLCRYLNTAVKLARYQRRIALALDDVQLAMKCTINEAYNYIHAGEIGYAKRLIRRTWTQAKERAFQEKINVWNRDSSSSMDVVLGMCRSALWFAKAVERAGLREDEELDVTSSTTSSSEVHRQATRDDFLRIRIVTSK